MFRNYFTVAVRDLLRHKLHFFINVFGLSSGIAFCVLAFVFVRNELTYDAFHKQADSIYRVYSELQPWNEVELWGGSWMPLAPVLKEEVPEIRQATRMHIVEEMLVGRGKEAFKDRVLFADPSVLEMFSFPLRHGDVSAAHTRTPRRPDFRITPM